jgi:hypothetical protein
MEKTKIIENQKQQDDDNIRLDLRVSLKPNVKTKFAVKIIKPDETYSWLLKKHYAKRIPPIEYAFGLYREYLVGIITFGTPVSGNLRMAFGEKYKMMELNRLVVNEDLPKNTLSFFVAHALKFLPKPLIVVSYADTTMKHHGYIYQACNFIYTGLSAKRTDWKIKGMEHLHGATIADMSRGKEHRAEYMRQKFGDDFYLEDRPRKHRYFFFLGNKKTRNEMLKLLPYKIEQYPKGINQRYEAGFEPNIQQTLF